MTSGCVPWRGRVARGMWEAGDVQQCPMAQYSSPSLLLRAFWWNVETD